MWQHLPRSPSACYNYSKLSRPFNKAWSQAAASCKLHNFPTCFLLPKVPGAQLWLFPQPRLQAPSAKSPTKTETNPSCDSSGRKLLLQASLKGVWMNLEIGSSWFSVRLFCAAGIYRVVKGVSCRQNLCVWLGNSTLCPKE